MATERTGTSVTTRTGIDTQTGVAARTSNVTKRGTATGSRTGSRTGLRSRKRVQEGTNTNLQAGTNTDESRQVQKPYTSVQRQKPGRTSSITQEDYGVQVNFVINYLPGLGEPPPGV